MAKLNLNKKKLINEDNLRAIISYGLGFASRVKTLEDKEIAPFEANKMYLKDSLCIYNDYIYMAKVTNQSATFNENYWTLLGDDITELSKTDIEAMLGLTTEEIETLSKIILDTEVELSKTWSSSKIYTDIQNAIDTSKAYTLAELGKISGASYKVVSATSEMTDEKIIYLLDNSGVFDMYIVDGGIPTKIGDTNIDLSDYYTKTEVDNDFLKKTDATSTYATKTELQDKVDKTAILSGVSGIPSDEKVLSEKATKVELDKKANDDEVVKKTDITTTLDSTSTDTQVPSAKVVYDKLEEINTNFQDGVNTIYNSVVAKGVTPTDKSPSSIASAISGFGNIELSSEKSSSEFTVPAGAIKAFVHVLGYWASNNYQNNIVSLNGESVQLYDGHGLAYDAAVIFQTYIIDVKEGDVISFLDNNVTWEHHFIDYVYYN